VLLAFERNIDYQMSQDLKQAGGNEVLEKPIQLHASLRAPQHTYDLIHKKYLGLSKEIQFTLDPWQPSLFAVGNDQNAVESLLRCPAKVVDGAVPTGYLSLPKVTSKRFFEAKSVDQAAS
jgi:hypothetical protein